jgi:hypothetical protein
MEHPSYMVGNHINDFICVQKHGWDIVFFGFDGDPIYDIKGNLQIRNACVFPLEGLVFYMYIINVFGNQMMI